MQGGAAETAAPFRVTVIGGCGHVGLPLSIALAVGGHEVCVYDIDLEALDCVRAGRMPFREIGAEERLKVALASGRLRLTADPSAIARADVVILVIGTPVDEHLNPGYPLVRKVLEQLLEHFRDGQLLILRSTVYPGTSERIRQLLHAGGKKVQVSFCPERIAEGHAFEELHSLPQIVSGFSPEAVSKSTQLFRTLTDRIIELSPGEAELAKLFNNVYRYIKFAIANQFYEIASDFGVDFFRIYHAMTHEYPRARDFPRPGFAAGPCLFKDTMQLAAFNNNNFFLGHAAMLINEGLPNYVVRSLKAKHDLARKTVGILGMAFKADSDDKRESLSYKLRRILEIEAASVLCSDVYIEDPRFVSPEELIRRSDILILGAPHSDYRQLDLAGKTMVDVWNFFGRGALI
jgi:UDP-N-acetyl-D-mannosaminuronic acid dehydrogenase